MAVNELSGLATGQARRNGMRRNAARLRAQLHGLLERSHGSHGASHVLDCFLVTLILLNVLAVLLESMEHVRRAFAEEFYWFEILSVAVFSIEYLLRLWVCVETKLQQGRAPWRVRLRYAVSAGAIVDLLAVLPFYLGAFGLLGEADMRVLRVLRLLRLFKLSRYADSMHLFWEVLRENAANFVAALGLLLVVMILAASGIYVLERNAQPEAFGSIPSAMWWAFVTLTTVGYGDVTPVTPVGRAFGAAITVVSIGIVALPAGLLASSFSARLRRNTDVYRGAADVAAADGVITSAEHTMLELKRLELGLGEGLAADILADERMRHGGPGVCPTCGHRSGS